MKYEKCQWLENNIPFSKKFNDIYYSKKDGLSESSHVFLAGNQILTKLVHQDKISIAETGFGFGLNFLNTWLHWQNQPHQKPSLHYLSFEKYPISPRDIKKSYQQWSHLIPLGDQLIHQYPLPLKGFHQLIFENGKIILTLVFGDINQTINDINYPFDCWYLDGFNPKTNLEMWNENLFLKIAHNTKPQGSLATFSVAKIVKESLKKVGFKIEKKPGFNSKREMLTASLENKPLAKNQNPWFSYQQLPKTNSKKAIIIGAGLAGCFSAYFLEKKGYEIHLYDQHQKIAHEASGNEIGILFPQLNLELNDYSLFYHQAFLFTLNLLNQLDPQQNFHHKTGMIQFPRKDREIKKFESILEKINLPSEYLNYYPEKIEHLKINSKLIHYSNGCWIKPSLLCEKLTQSNRITKILNTKIHSIDFNHQWKIYDQDKLIDEAEIVILCLGSYQPFQYHFPIQAVRGQVTKVKFKSFLNNLQQILCYGGYITPAIEGYHHLGATFDPKNTNPQIEEIDHQKNIELLSHYFDLTDNLEIEKMSGRVSFRSILPDRFPLIGSIPHNDFYHQEYFDLHHGNKYQIYQNAEYQKGLFINTAHASRGLLSTSLGSSYLANLINHDPLPISQSMIQKLHPARFLIKKLKQNPNN